MTRVRKMGSAVVVGVLLALAVAELNVSAEDRSIKDDMNKLKQLTQMTHRTGPVIELNAQSYLRYAIDTSGDRPYQAAVLFTAPAAYCNFCSDGEKYFRRVASHYYSAGSMRFSNDTSVSPPVFFFMVDVFSHRIVAQLHNLRSAPVVALVNPRSLSSEGGDDSNQKVIQPQDRMTPDSEISLLSWINAKTGHNVVKIPTWFEQLGVTGVMLCAICLVSLLGRKVASLNDKYPFLIGVLALCVQWLGTSGLVWSFQHSAAFYGIDRNTQQLIFFMKVRKGQYLGEGLLMALASVVFAMLWLAMATLTARKRKRNDVVIMCLLVAALGIYTAIFRGHELKSGIYNVPIFPPAHYSRGPLYKDRGNSF